MSPSLLATDLFTVQGLVAVVTGGATGEFLVNHASCRKVSVTENIGIGLMIAKALEENGAKVYIVGRRKDVLESVAKKEAVRLDKCSNSHGSARSGLFWIVHDDLTNLYTEIWQPYSCCRRRYLKSRLATNHRANFIRSRLHQPTGSQCWNHRSHVW